MYRVQKVLSLLGILSRRECERKIQLGLITINNRTARLGSIIKIGDKISYNNNEYLITNDTFIISTKILMYHKPINEIVSRHDPQRRDSVFNKLPDVVGKWINIGRLDYKTSGLLLFTNNGDIANKMMHPSMNIIRTYEVTVHGSFNIEKQKLSLKGIDIGNSEIGKFIALTQDKILKNKYIVKLNTGKNREIRRIFSHLDCKVINLKRISYGSIQLGKLKLKSFKFLDDKQISEFI